MDTTQFIKQSHDENMGILKKLENETDQMREQIKEKKLGDVEVELADEDTVPEEKIAKPIFEPSDEDVVPEEKVPEIDDFRLEENDLVK